MNVDQAELSKFNTLAKDWWDENGACRFLHQLNPLRLQWIEKFSELNGKKILDIGCGGGILSESMAKRGALVTGIDLANDAIHIAKKHSEKSGLQINYQLISAESLADIEPHTYDIITCLEILEHVPDPSSIIKAISKLIKPNGKVYFATLNRNLKSFFYAIFGAEFALELLPKGTHQYERFITPAELSRNIRQTGMEVIAITGIKSNLTGSHFEFSQDVSINYMIACQYAFEDKKI